MNGYLRWRVIPGVLCALALLLGALPAHAQAGEAVTPVPRADNERWMARHESMNARVQEGNVDLLFIGDSITQGWEGHGKPIWDLYYADRNAVNLGIGGDRTQHVLWRLQNGNIEGISPKLAVLMIGTNNASANSAEEIAEGIAAIVGLLRAQLPEMKVLLLAIFPREEKPGDMRDKLAQASAAARDAVAEDPMVHYLDIGRWFLTEDGTLPEAIMPDFLHPQGEGYTLWAQAIEPMIAELLGEVAANMAPKGFVPLFNGKDLRGWKGLADKNATVRRAMTPEALQEAQAQADEEMRQHWSVEDGALFFDGNGSHLCTTSDYEDFELLVDWKIEEGGDSGLYLRGTPQVQIWDPAQRPQGSGGLFNNKIGPSDPLVPADNPIGEWNTFRILMVGDKVTIYLNEKLIVDNVALENYWDPETPLADKDQIELQAHGHKTWFRNIYLRAIPRERDWKSIFNGEDLTGWEPVDSPRNAWGTEEGLLFTTGEGGGWLSSAEEYEDFELRLDYRVPENGNSGVFIRAPRGGNPAFEGSEIQVLDDYGSEYRTLEPWQYTGAVYATAAPSRRVTLPAGEWQQMRIRADGPHVQVWVNGLHVVDTNLNDHLDKLADHPGLTRTRGYLGFQNHGSRLDYRNIELHELNK